MLILSARATRTQAEPVSFVLAPKEEWIIRQRPQEARRIFLRRAASGRSETFLVRELVGDCENGELVVDTSVFPTSMSSTSWTIRRSLPGPMASAPDRTPAPLADGRSQPAPALEAAGARLM